MNRRFFYIIVITLSALLAPSAQAAKIKQQLDSAYLLMGKKTAITIEMLLDGKPQGAIVVQDTKMPAEVEISDAGQTDTVNLGNDRWQLRRTLTIQSFDSGLYTLPPVLYVAGNETIVSSPLALKVIPVAVDSLKDIHDYAPAAPSGLRWFDRLPDWLVDYGWLIITVLLIAAAAAFCYFRFFYRRKESTEVRKIKVEPPYEAAIRELNDLHNRRLCEQGREKEFYTRLTEILRVYLQLRFGINAMEMTSSDILRELHANESTRMSRNAMAEVLNMADFVKFAKVRPLPDDNANVFRMSVKFVEDTRPVLDVEPENHSGK